MAANIFFTFGWAIELVVERWMKRPIYGFGPALFRYGLVFAIGLIQSVLLLRIRVAPPQGLLVTRQSASGLFDELDRISDAIGCRHFKRVYLTSDYNASVNRVPSASAGNRCRNAGVPKVTSSPGFNQSPRLNIRVGRMLSPGPVPRRATRVRDGLPSGHCRQSASIRSLVSRNSGTKVRQ